jgi:D-3-phosphoglycerate dehydrogenase
MHVVAYDPFVSAEYAARLGVELLPLGELLGRSDFISLHTPLTESTRGLIGARALALVKPGARLINCARGALGDEEALLAALDDGRLAGAALDVFPQEPPFGSRLINHPKVIVTPHLGASTAEAQASVARDVARQVIAVLQGCITEHAVNAPLVSPETFEALIPYIRMVECLCQFYTQVGDGRIERVRVIYSGELANYDTTPLRAAVVKGLLEPVSEERINLVNAHLVARRRGLEIIEEKTTHVSHYTDMVTLEVTTDQGVRSVAGTILRDEPHIVRVDNYWLDVVAKGCLLVCHNQDRPGVIGRVGTLLGEADVNIAFMQVGRETPRGEAIMILGLDDTVPPGVYDRLRAVPGLSDVRVVHLGRRDEQAVE